MPKRAAIDHFEGFPPETFNFLKMLGKNNNKLWFDEHRPDYLEYVAKPLKSLVQEVAPVIMDIDPELQTTPAINKTVSRIQKDSRFGRGKVPYKTVQWIIFKRPGKDWKNYPSFYMDLKPNSYNYGMGFYRADAATIRKFREQIDQDPEGFKKLLQSYDHKRFKVKGRPSKTPVRPDAGPDLQPWYDGQGFFYLGSNSYRPSSKGISADLAERLAHDYRSLQPMYDFMKKASEAAASGSRDLSHEREEENKIADYHEEDED